MARSRKADEHTDEQEQEEVIEEETQEEEETQLSVAELAAKIKELQLRKRQAEDEERANKPVPRRGRGVMAEAKKILWYNPDIEIAELHKQVVSKCGPCSLTVIQTTRSDFRNTIEVLRELGKLKEEPPTSSNDPEDDHNEGDNGDNESEDTNEVVKDDQHEESPRQERR